MMNWQQLITTKRLGLEHKHVDRHDDRTEFKRDYDRLIFSAPFRRLQNKTQVFPLPGSVFVHNRLTHSLEVASVGTSLGDGVAAALIGKHPELANTLVSEIGQIVATGCLAHDLGNPPFGHSGEKAIQSFFTEGKGAYLKNMVSDELWSDITHFEGNANAFRLLTHRFQGRRKGGFVMTYPSLACIVKYPYSSTMAGKKGKFGFFASEQQIFRTIADEMGVFCKYDGPEGVAYCRHPLVYLVEAADDICYEIMDIEDAHKLKILSYKDTVDLLLQFFSQERRDYIMSTIDKVGLTDDNEKIVYMRTCVIGELIKQCITAFVDNEQEILSGNLNGSLIDNIDGHRNLAYKYCASVSAERIYRSKPVLDVELSGYKIIETLMHQMTEAVVYPDRYLSQQLINRVSSQYDIHSDNLETRIMAVIDYVSGMTDVYALDIYQKIIGTSLPII